MLVGYYLPNRGCSHYQQGAPDAETYVHWTNQPIRALGPPGRDHPVPPRAGTISTRPVEVTTVRSYPVKALVIHWYRNRCAQLMPH